MELVKIQIENFRSIKSQTIVFDHNCLILVGKNEAGKSNILKAIAAVFGQYEVSNRDKRKRIDNEKIDAKNYYIRAILKLSEKDFDKVLKRFQEKYTNTECIVFISGKTLRDYIKSAFYQLLIRIDIANEKSTRYVYWTHTKDDFKLKNEIYLSANDLNTVKTGTKQSLLPLIFDEVVELYNENPYNCHYWEYDSKNLLPNSIDVADFREDPSVCLPLKNIFTLSNREDIEQEFTDAESEDGDYENLLEQVSKKATQVFRTIWQDFKDTSIELRKDGTEILVKIANKAKYSCEDRSDGFKKFISILLMLSTQTRTNKIGERDIILIDEPDQSLYPTSARHLRDELLKIAEKAKVIYSTHSPYMIDSDCIDRHLIVEKKDDITTANKQVGNASFSNDELLRQAIGSSIFECLQDKNIIFEGWLDKELFQKYCSLYKKTNDFNNIGKVHLDGIKGVETLIQLLILANKKFIIVTDSDAVSNQRRKDFEKNYREFAKCWLSYADVIKDISTMEDFITSTHISNCIKENQANFVYNESKSAIENIDVAFKNDKELKQSTKNNIVKKLSKKDIKDEYNTFIAHLKETVDKL